MYIILLIPLIILIIFIFLLHKLDDLLKESYSDILENIIKFKYWIFLFISIILLSVVYIEINEFLDIKNRCNFRGLTFNSLITYIEPIFIDKIYGLINIYFFMIVLLLLKILPNKTIKFISNSFLAMIFTIFTLFPFIANGQYMPQISYVKANMHTLQTMLETYAVDYGGIYPKDLNELRKDANKKGYWKEVKNPYKRSNKSFVDISFLKNKTDCLYSLKGEEIFYEVGLVIYNPIINKQNDITKYYIYGTYLLDKKSTKLIEDKGQIFYLTNS
ncbi:MAG: hypothetical protein ACK4IX_12760 [Candidatus Sericytochromatia bacterium]